LEKGAGIGVVRVKTNLKWLDRKRCRGLSGGTGRLSKGRPERAERQQHLTIFQAHETFPDSATVDMRKKKKKKAKTCHYTRGEA